MPHYEKCCSVCVCVCMNTSLLQDLFPRLCMSEALSNAWTNYSNNSTLSINDGLLLHFYGDQESGIIRTNPYFSHDPKSDVCSLRQLDPRFRPVSYLATVSMVIASILILQWYVSTVTASKAIYVLLHSNKFDMLPLMREAAVRLLNTLSHQDYFLIWYSNGNRFSDNFVLTNESTRVKIEQFINSSTQQKLNPSLSIGVHLTEVITLFGYVCCYIISTILCVYCYASISMVYCVYACHTHYTYPHTSTYTQYVRTGTCACAHTTP